MRAVLCALLVAGLVAGCGRAAGGGEGTRPGAQAAAATSRLVVTVADMGRRTRYTLTCGPAGGSAPHPAAACRALTDFVRRHGGAPTLCKCPMPARWITVRGALAGHRLRRPLTVSWCAACGLGARAVADVRAAFRAFGLPTG
jgi:hypothetical protein